MHLILLLIIPVGIEMNFGRINGSLRLTFNRTSRSGNEFWANKWQFTATIVPVGIEILATG